jgi:hypothetical protein
VRHSLLLPAMSDRHVRPTKTSASGSVQAGRRGLWLVSIALPVAVVIPAVIYVVDRPQLDEIETVIRQAGFDPLVPPNRLRGPGALYEVEGGFYRKVCDADTAVVTEKLKKSPSQSQLRERLENGGFSLSGKFVSMLNAELGSTRLTSIELKLTDVTISEIAMSDLLEISNNLLSQKYCDEVVNRLLKANRQVCPGYAALSATTLYKVHLDTKFDSNAEDKVPIIEAVQQAIQQDADGRIRIQSADEISGDSLFYGIQLSPLCITTDTATESSSLPQSPVQEGPNLLGRLWAALN